MNGVCYVENGCAPDGILENRDPFALPRVNVAWDIDGEGNNVLRGGYGIFYNRNMGNVEYGNTLRLAPNAYQVATDFWAGGGYGNGLGLTYDTIHRGDAGQPHRQHRHQLADAGFVQVPEDAQLQHVVSRGGSRGTRCVEASYVGTRGRDLVSRSNGNVMPYGVLSTGTFNGVDLSVPVNRVAVASVGDNLAAFRPYNALNAHHALRLPRRRRHYDSLQVTLSRQTGRRLQYFVAYTLGRDPGHAGWRVLDHRSLRSRSHLRRAHRGSHARPERVVERVPARRRPGRDEQRLRPRPAERLAAVGHLVDGERHSMSAELHGRRGQRTDRGRLLRHRRRRRARAIPAATGCRRSTTCDPRLGGNDVGEKLLDIGCISVPASARTAIWSRRTTCGQPTRFNHDLTLFKNFEIRGDQKLQFRVGFFNIFNQAFANDVVNGNDINLTLDTTCNVLRERRARWHRRATRQRLRSDRRVQLHAADAANFGKINLKRGHRVIELVLKYYF